MSKGPKTHHIVPNPNGGWDVKRGGAERASSHHETKREAIESGRTVSRNQGRAADPQPGWPHRRHRQPRRRPVPAQGLN